MQHLLMADETEETTFENRIFTWNWNLTNFFPTHKPEVFIQALEELQSSGQHVVEATDLLHKLDQLQRPATHWTFSSAAIMIAGSFILLALVWGGCNFCKKQATAVCAPTAPTTLPYPSQPFRPPPVPVTITYTWNKDQHPSSQRTPEKGRSIIEQYDTELNNF